MRTAALVLALCSCGSEPPPASTTPPPAPRAKLARPTNHCAEVAARLLATFAELEHHAPAPAMAAAYTDVVVERCTQDVWSAGAQACMLEPGADLDSCAAQLAPEQRASFAEAAQARLNAAGTATSGSGSGSGSGM